MDTRDIDRTHIIALQQVNGQFLNKVLPISRPEHFIAELNAMIDNPNRTVWDMQSLFATRFPKTALYMDYIHPYTYDSSYVNSIRYPDMKGYDELRDSWKTVADAARKSYVESCKQRGYVPNTSTMMQEGKRAADTLISRQKHDFINRAMRWIDASCYYASAGQLNRNGSVKMYSKENIGWSGFTHQISTDIKIGLKTNFGYGKAAYFMLAVQYKGLDILPFSYIVKYYKAGMTDIVRCTHSYRPCRESWSASFDFICDFINNSIADPQGFVKTYIMREVVEMMNGLEQIAANPKSFIDSIQSRTAGPCIINVRPMLGNEKIRMQSYPEEALILFKVEKITGALDFLNSLTAIAKEVKTVQPYIDRLLEINMSLYPEVQQAIAKINKKVDEQLPVKAELEAQISSLSKELAPFEEEISRLRANATKENPFSIREYESTHTGYVTLRDQKRNLGAELSKVYRLISDLKSFLNILNSSASKIEGLKRLKEAA